MRLWEKGFAAWKGRATMDYDSTFAIQPDVCLYSGDASELIMDDGNAGFLDIVAAGDGFELASPILSCASSLEGENLLEMNLIRSGFSTKTELTKNASGAGGAVNTGMSRKRKVENIIADNTEMQYLLFEDMRDSPLDMAEEEESSEVARKKQDHNSHTRKSREKLNDKFERLVDILPKTSEDFELKHKAQILDHTLVTLERLLEENKSLEMELALISRENVIKWVESIVSAAKSEEETFLPLLELLCMKAGGMIGELWKVSDTAPDCYQILRTTTSSDLHEELKEAAVVIEATNIHCNTPEAKLTWQCFTSMRSSLGDPACSPAIERRWGVRVWSSLAVPVLYSGRVKLVAILHSTRDDLDSSIFETADLVATCLGNAYSSKLFRSRST